VSGDLRAAVEGLRLGEDNIARHTGRGLDSIGYGRACHDVLRLIPEGAVLVTEETLAVAIGRAKESPLGDTVSRAIYHEFAAAILRHLREGT